MLPTRRVLFRAVMQLLGMLAWLSSMGQSQDRVHGGFVSAMRQYFDHICGMDEWMS